MFANSGINGASQGKLVKCHMNMLSRGFGVEKEGQLFEDL
jgi:hypothetical protein